MKRGGILILALTVLLGTVSVWGEDYTSILSEASFGLFWNAMDAAGSVNGAGAQPVFSKLKKPYLFGGLSNFSDLPTGSGYIYVPLTLGYYAGGDSPWAVFDNLLITTATSTLLDGIEITSTDFEDVTEGTEVIRYTWVDVTTETQYDCHEAWNISERIRFLKNLGSLTLGANLSVGYVQNADILNPLATWMATNRTETYSAYYNTAPGGVIPIPTLDYTRTRVSTSPDTQLALSLGVPLYLPLGGIGLEITPTLGWNSRNQSASSTEEYTAPADAGAGFFNVTTLDSVDDTWGSVDASVNATATLPSLFKGHPFNMFRVGLYGSAALYYAQPRVDTVHIQRYSYPGGGAPLVLTGGGPTQYDTQTDTRKGNFAFSLNPSVEHLLYMDLGPGTTFGAGPGVSVWVTSDPVDSYTTQSVLVERVDGNADGLYNNALDTITTTTTTYSHNNDGGTLDIGLGASLPMSVRFQPEGAPFGITVGCEIGVGYTAEIVSDAPTQTRTQVAVVNGTGAAVPYDPDTITAPEVAAQTRVNSIWEFTAQYGLAVNVRLPRDASLDIILRGSTSTDWLRVQVLIPLK